MLLYEYKLRLAHAQAAAIDEAIRTTQFIRNKCVRLWMDGRVEITNPGMPTAVEDSTGERVAAP